MGAARGRGPAKGGSRARFGMIRALPSGRFQASYVGPDQRRHNAPTTFVTKGDAGKWLSLVEADIITSRWRPPEAAKPTTETFGAFAARWLAGAELKPRTRDEYRRLLEDLAETFGDMALTGVTAASVADWHAGLPQGRRTGNAARYRLLHRIMQAAVVDTGVHGVTANPCNQPRWGKGPADRPIRPATVAQVETIAANMPPGLACAVHLAAWCGLRLGELAELRRGDVDLGAGLIRVERSVQWVAGEKGPNGHRTYHPVIGPPKSDAGVRTVTIPPHVRPLIAAHLAEHVDPDTDALIFCAPEGGQLRSAAVFRPYSKARAAAGRPDLRWHDLRHTGATFYTEAGATLKESMAYLGHSSARMALHYQHVADERPAELAERLSRMAGWVSPTGESEE